MDKKRWATTGIAALAILVAGAFVALAEERIEVKVEVEAEDGDRDAVVEVKTGDTVEVFTVDDLEDGEERVFQAGERTVTVRRSGDDIDVLMDGEELGAGGEGKRIRKIIKVGGEGDCDHGVLVHGDDENVWHVKEGNEGVKVIKIRKGEGGEELVWHGEDGDIDLETLIMDLEGDFEEGGEHEIDVFVEKLEGHHGAIFIGEGDGPHKTKMIKMMGGPHAGMVSYRCESTGSMLLVKEEHATLDSFIDPATGCLMNKVEVKDEHVMVIKTKVDVDEEE